MCETCDGNLKAKKKTLLIKIANTTKVNAACLFLIPGFNLLLKIVN